MDSRRLPVCGIGLAFLIVACGGGDQAQTPKGSGGNHNAGGGGSGNSAGITGARGGSAGNKSSTQGSAAGATGATGATGAKGATGATGASGATGATGGGGASGKAGSDNKGGGGGKTSSGSQGGALGGAGAAGKAGGGVPAATGGAAGKNGGPAAGGSTAPGDGGGTDPGTPAANVVVTSTSGAFWKTATLTEDGSGTVVVTVNDSSTAQTWEGFGGAFNEKGWSYLTTKALQDQAIQLLFGNDGCRFAWGRIPIGASDYAMDRYSLDEVPNGGTDPDMSKFSIDRDKEKLIPYIKAAQAIKSDIRFWASPWTPPTWMKTGPYSPGTGKPSNSNFDGGVMKSDEATLTAYAKYLVKFVQAYKEQGIDVEVVSPQNEPNYQQNYPSCHWEASTFVTFVGKYLGPALSSASLTTKVMDGTLSNPSGDADIGSKVLGDSSAKQYIGAIGVQWGMSDSGQVSKLKSAGIPIWLSETKCDGNQNSSGPAPNDMTYATSTWSYITGAIKNGLTAYNAWNMVLDKNGLGIDDTRMWAQNTLIIADGGTLTPTPAYYVYRHFSQYVDPGAKVVGTSGGDAIGFKNPDGSLVAVMRNSGSANSNYVVSIGGKKLQFAMPGNGWATVKYTP